MAVKLSTKPIEYILEVDRTLDPSEQTKFLIRPLTASENAHTQDIMKIRGKGDDLSIENSGSYNLEVLRCGLVGWSNFKDADGNEVRFGKIQSENLDCLCNEYRQELALEIISLSSLNKAQEKN